MGELKIFKSKKEKESIDKIQIALGIINKLKNIKVNKQKSNFNEIQQLLTDYYNLNILDDENKRTLFTYIKGFSEGNSGLFKDVSEKGINQQLFNLIERLSYELEKSNKEEKKVSNK